MLPYSVRRRVTTIREYVRRYSKQSLEYELKKSNEDLRVIPIGDCNQLPSATSRDTYDCFGLKILKLRAEGEKSPNENYASDLVDGCKSLVRVAIHNKASMLKSDTVRIELLKGDGFLIQYNS